MKYRALVLAMGMAGLAACGGGDEAAQRARSAGSDTSDSDITTGLRRDFDALDICEKIPAADVASALGGTPKGEPVRTTIAGMGTQCLYTLTIDGQNVDARISASQPDFWDPTLGEGERQLSDLGDSAYATETGIGAGGKAHDIYLLKRGDAEINVTTNSFERARALAELALSRL